MNMHVPQSIAAETELTQLASVLRLIVSPRINAPIIQMVQDTLTGAYRISNPDALIHEQAAMNMLGRIRRPLTTFKMKGGSLSGRQELQGCAGSVDRVHEVMGGDYLSK
jgi:DNA-directed RNA polymerase beta' subunit